LPHLYRYYAAGERANHCIDAALTLAAAFGQFGISAQAWPVELVINPADGRAATRYGAYPRWDGADFRGHCVLWLPEHQHFVDVTLEQFAETARQEPLIGRAVLAVDPVTGRGTAVDWAAAGGTAVVQRPTMFHPMHVHGHTLAIRGNSGPGPRKDTVIVRPHQTVVADLVADNPGQWATHCHNAYHAETGMMTRLSYQR